MRSSSCSVYHMINFFFLNPNYERVRWKQNIVHQGRIQYYGSASDDLLDVIPITHKTTGANNTILSKLVCACAVVDDVVGIVITYQCIFIFIRGLTLTDICVGSLWHTCIILYYIIVVYNNVLCGREHSKQNCDKHLPFVFSWTNFTRFELNNFFNPFIEW